MVQHPNPGSRSRQDVERGERLSRLDQPQKMEGAVEHPDVGFRGNDRGGLAVQADATDDVTLGSRSLQGKGQVRDQSRALGCAEKQGPGPGRRASQFHRPTHQAGQAAHKFAPGRIQGR